MFASKGAKAQTKAGASSSLAPVARRSMLAAQLAPRPAQHVDAQGSLGVRTAPRSSVGGAAAGGAGAPGALSGPAWDFSKIDISPADPAERRHARAPQPVRLPAKLAFGEVSDPLEHEADRVADQVTRAPEPSLSLTSAPAQAGRKEEDKRLQKKPAGATGPAPLAEAPSAAHGALRSAGQPLDDAVRTFMEPRFGHDFSQVRIHTDGSAAAGARVAQARAYTAGDDIVFGAGQYAPQTAAGRHLLAHELTHVVQQQRAPGPPGVLMRAPDPTPTSLDQFSETDRQSLKFDTDALGSPLVLNQFFGLKGTVVAATNVNADIDIEIPAVEAVKDTKVKSDLYRGLRQVALSVFDLQPGSDGKAHSSRLHLVHIESLDLTRYGGPKGSFRFTCVGKEAAGAITARILVEAVGAPAKGMADPGAVKDIEKRKVAPYGLKRGASITDDALWEKVERSLGTVDEALIMRIRDVTFETSPQQVGPDGEAASFDFSFKKTDTGPWKKSITLFQKIVSAQDADFARILDHELGHAIDFAPAEKPGGQIAKGEAHNLPKFLEAAKKDGGRAKAITDRGKLSDKEFYAENLSLFIQQPDTFQALRPNLYNYFVAYEWEAVRNPKLNAPSTVWSTAPKAKP